MNIVQEALSKRHLLVQGGLGERRHSAVLQRRSDLEGFKKGFGVCLHASPFFSYNPISLAAQYGCGSDRRYCEPQVYVLYTRFTMKNP